jgi:exodeoxyribonuclease VIII
LVHNLSTLRIEAALAIITREEEVDIYAIPSRFLVPAKAMAEAEKDVRFTAWWKQLRRTPGILDYSRAAVIALIKSAPEDLYLDPGKLRDYINRELTETNHAKPDQATIDVACGKARIKKDHAVPAAPAQSAEKEAQPKVEKIGEGMFSVENLMTGSTASKQNIDVSEHRQAITPRQIEIAHALNDLLSGRTDIMGKEEAESVVSCTGHMIPHIVPMLIDTIITTESCLSPAFSDEEIHDVATTILDAWTDNAAGREKVATDAIVQYRSVPELPQPAVIDPPVVTVKTKKPAGAAPAENRQRSSLSYLQQLTIAALQGLAANPVHGNALDDLPAIAADLAAGVIRQQEQADE